MLLDGNINQKCATCGPGRDIFVAFGRTLKFFGKLKLHNFGEILICERMKKSSLTNLGSLGKSTAVKL